VSPRVSVVLTTFARPHLVAKAVASVLVQTVRDLELIVVLDGPDAETERVLRDLPDPRVRVRVREERGGQPAAINTGVALARASWTALLDDDDEWHPEKLAVQLRAAESSASPEPVIGCRFLARSESGDVLWPLRPPRPGERASEYLFCRSQFAFGEGILPTSVLFGPTDLFRREPMSEDLVKHCDIDWLCRVDRLDGTSVEVPFGEKPLAVWQRQGGRERRSNQHDWRLSRAWITRLRERVPGAVTERAYAGFLLTWVSLSARTERDLAAFPFLLKEALRHGRPGARELLAYAAVWGLPLDFRARVSQAMAVRPRTA